MTRPAEHCRRPFAATAAPSVAPSSFRFVPLAAIPSIADAGSRAFDERDAQAEGRSALGSKQPSSS